MGYWGWRPLVCGVFISTWVVGCNIVTNYISPSAYPDVTLTVGRLPTAQIATAPPRGAPTRTFAPEATETPSPEPTQYVIQPGDTLDSIAERFHLSVEAIQSANDGTTTLIPGETLIIPTETPLPLDVQSPTCYETRPGSLLCLGRVNNPLDFPVEDVSVAVKLRQEDGTVYQSGRSTVEQMIIPAGSFAPYQTTFAAESNAFSSTDAELISAVEGVDDGAVLLIQDVQGERLDGRVVVSAVIYNPGSQNAQILRVFVTLLDEFDRVIGYRVLTLEPAVILNAGGNFPVRIEVTPQVSEATPEYALYVEARSFP